MPSGMRMAVDPARQNGESPQIVSCQRWCTSLLVHGDDLVAANLDAHIPEYAAAPVESVLSKDGDGALLGHSESAEKQQEGYQSEAKHAGDSRTWKHSAKAGPLAAE